MGLLGKKSKAITTKDTKYYEGILTQELFHFVDLRALRG
jgi:hypothetical protein